MTTNYADVIVFGAGPSGISAAITAARNNYTVILIEHQNKIGGVMSTCPGMMLGAGYPCGITIGGSFEEFVAKMYNQSPPVAERRKCSLENFGDEVVYSHEHAISILYEMLDETNVDLRINHISSHILMENDEIKGVEIVNSQNCELFVAKIYIDCTGNGDIADRAGVPSQKGNEENLMMGVSLTFFLENVDWTRAFKDSEDPYFTKYAKIGIERGKIHPSIEQIYMLKGFREGSVFFNTVTVTEVDGTNSSSVIHGTKLARRRVMDLAKFCREEIPGFEQSYISNIGPTVGIRETRRLEGMYQLTFDDLQKATKFTDGIVACDNPLDEVFRNEANTKYTHDAAISKGNYYTIPFRSLIPKKVKNLLFAGRNISVDSKAFSSIRGMPQCMIMGQGAGIGAAYAISNHCCVQEIDCSKVVDSLITLGVNGIGNRELIDKSTNK